MLRWKVCGIRDAETAAVAALAAWQALTGDWQSPPPGRP